jgi:hypothetical protein
MIRLSRPGMYTVRLARSASSPSVTHLSADIPLEPLGTVRHQHLSRRFMSVVVISFVHSFWLLFCIDWYQSQQLDKSGVK